MTFMDCSSSRSSSVRSGPDAHYNKTESCLTIASIHHHHQHLKSFVLMLCMSRTVPPIEYFYSYECWNSIGASHNVIYKSNRQQTSDNNLKICSKWLNVKSHKVVLRNKFWNVIELELLDQCFKNNKHVSVSYPCQEILFFWVWPIINQNIALLQSPTYKIWKLLMTERGAGLQVHLLHNIMLQISNRNPCWKGTVRYKSSLTK